MALARFFRASDFHYLDTSVHLNDYNKERVETRSPLDYFQSQFRRQKTTLSDIVRRSHRTPHRWDPVIDHIKQPRNLFFYRGLIPSASSILQITLLIYLLTKYLSLPIDLDTGRRERVGNLYSIWPFTSCVGSHHLSQYLGLKLSILTLNATSTSITCKCGWDDPIAWQLRRAVWIFSLIVYGLGTWAVIASKDVDRTTHLFATAAELTSLYTLRGLAFSMDHVTRLRFRSMFEVWAIRVDRNWKVVTMSLAFPLGLMTTVSIYMCDFQDLAGMRTPGNRCYKVMAMGAIAEWLFLITSVSWSASVAFELFTAVPAEEAREREETEERKALIEEEAMVEEGGRTSRDTSHEQAGDYIEGEGLTRFPSSRPPSYASRAPTLDEDAYSETDGLVGLSKPRTARMSNGSRWSALTVRSSGYDSVSAVDEAFDDATQVRTIV